MIIITGGAGFIGSGLLWGLNQKDISDVLIVDEIDHDPVKSPGGDHGASEKEHNIAGLKYEELIGIKDFREKLLAGGYDRAGVTAVLHMGAISSTTETNWDLLLDNNVEYSKDIIRWCQSNNVRCVYASSGATYGDGSKGYSDNHDLFDELKPLNLYGRSKLLVDIWARDGGFLESAAGVRYFNVFGPNEYHKEGMASVPFKKFAQMQDKGYIELFQSNNPEYKDGEQMRDFVYIKDAVKATLWLMDHSEVNGVFNVGTGKARSWNDVAEAMFASTGKKPSIKYIPMPKNLANQYQNFTEADISKLRAAGYTEPMTGLEDAISDYIKNYLQEHKHLE